MENLAKLFGSLAKVKIMKLFLANPEKVFDITDVSSRTKVAQPVAKKEINTLHKTGLIKEKAFFKETPSLDNSDKKQVKKKRISGWALDQKSPLVFPLQNLLINIEPLVGGEIIKKLNDVGKLKLVVVAGIFIQNPDSRVDILIVGDKIKKASVEKSIGILESEIGKELSYAVLETEDFKYRLGVYDKLVRDILDYPHRKLIDRIGFIN